MSTSQNIVFLRSEAWGGWWEIFIDKRLGGQLGGYQNGSNNLLFLFLLAWGSRYPAWPGEEFVLINKSEWVRTVHV